MTQDANGDGFWGWVLGGVAVVGAGAAAAYALSRVDELDERFAPLGDDVSRLDAVFPERRQHWEPFASGAVAREQRAHEARLRAAVHALASESGGRPYAGAEPGGVFDDKRSAERFAERLNAEGYAWGYTGRGLSGRPPYTVVCAC